MKRRTYFLTTSVVFVLVAAVHFLRVVFDWPARIGAWDIPMWVSWLAFVIAGTLTYHGFRMNKKNGKPEPLIEKQAREKAENLRKVLEMFDGQERVVNDDVEKALGVSDATATNYLEELERQGKIRQVGTTGQGVYYELKNERLNRGARLAV